MIRNRTHCKCKHFRASPGGQIEFKLSAKCIIKSSNYNLTAFFLILIASAMAEDNTSFVSGSYHIHHQVLQLLSANNRFTSLRNSRNDVRSRRLLQAFRIHRQSDRRNSIGPSESHHLSSRRDIKQTQLARHFAARFALPDAKRRAEVAEINQLSRFDRRILLREFIQTIVHNDTFFLQR